MVQALLDYFQASPLSLWGPFIALLLCGVGLPVPEDLVLVTAGVLGAMDGQHWAVVSACMYVGVIGGDSLIFFAGRRYGRRFLAWTWFQRVFPPAKHAKVEALFEKHGTTGLFMGRFLPGLRAPLFFTAGLMKVPYLKFLCMDGTAALLSVPVFVWLGHWAWVRFNDDLEAMNRALARTHAYSLWGAAALFVLVVGGVVWWSRRRKNARAAGTGEPEEPPAAD